MEQQSASGQLAQYLPILWARKWVLLGSTLAGLAAAVVYAVSVPDRFRSTTLIMVTPQKVPEKFVASTVTTDIQERLSSISQQILSRTALEQVINEFGLFQEEKKKRYSPEEIVGAMRRNVALKVNRDARKGADAFELAYVAGDPKVAQLVTNRLAGFFVEENLKVREQQAMGTSAFLGEEIERYRGQVQQKEQEIYGFKRRYMNELNDQFASNQARLTELQNRLQLNSQTTNSAKDRKVVLQQQLSDIEKRVQEERQSGQVEARASRRQKVSQTAGEAPARPQPSPLQQELARQKEELARLRLTHTEKHPDVTRLAASVKRLEEQVAREAPAAAVPPAQPAAQPEAPEPVVRVEYPPHYSQVKADLARTDAEIARLEAEVAPLRQSIEIYQARIANTPTRELQMKQLSEGYTAMKAALDGLTDKKLQADISENMEKKQKGEQFRLLDPANLPTKPFEPNRVGFLGIGVTAGLALGAAIVFLLDFARPRVRTRADLVALRPDLTVLGVIAQIDTEADQLRRRRVRLLAAGAAGASLVVAALVVQVAVGSLPQVLGKAYGKLAKTHWTTERR